MFSTPISKPVHAATDYIDPNGDGSTGSWNTTGTSYYTEIDEAIRQSNTPTTSDNIYGQANQAGTIFLRMSSLTNVSSVSQITVWVYHNDGGSQLSAQLYDDDESTTRSVQSNFTSRTADTWDSVTFSSLSLTQAQLDSLSVALTANHTGGKPPTMYVYAMYAEVTYTSSISISLNTDGSVAFGTMDVNTTEDTTSSGINDVETISVDSGPANLDVRSTSFSDGTNTWSLGTSNGSEQILWEFSNDGTNWSTFAVADTLYTHETNVAQGNTSNLFLRLTTPTTTVSSNQHSATVTIVASAP